MSKKIFMNSFDENLNSNENGTPQEKYGILVVDDSFFAQKQIKQILESSEFFVVDTAVDGDEAVFKYKENQERIKIVTMDITMPGKNGIEALKEILEYDKDAKIVMISSLGKQEVIKESLMLGAKGFILKPLDRKQVLDQLSMIVKKFLI